jgi:hypothetical protein
MDKKTMAEISKKPEDILVIIFKGDRTLTLNLPIPEEMECRMSEGMLFDFYEVARKKLKKPIASVL